MTCLICTDDPERTVYRNGGIDDGMASLRVVLRDCRHGVGWPGHLSLRVADTTTEAGNRGDSRAVGRDIVRATKSASNRPARPDHHGAMVQSVVEAAGCQRQHAHQLPGSACLKRQGGQSYGFVRIGSLAAAPANTSPSNRLEDNANRDADQMTKGAKQPRRSRLNDPYACVRSYAL